jgi:hypothetical protein
MPLSQPADLPLPLSLALPPQAVDFALDQLNFAAALGFNHCNFYWRRKWFRDTNQLRTPSKLSSIDYQALTQSHHKNFPHFFVILGRIY